MGLQFPSDIANSKDVFLMYATGFSVSPGQSGVRQHKTIKQETAISLPTPSEGISLNESGNWEETAGYQSTEGFFRGAGGKAIMEAGGNIGKATLAKGRFVNDYASQSYSGSNFRSYTFTWDLIPDSLEEAKSISDIIKKIRVHSLPSYSGSMLVYPDMWQVYPAMNTEVGLYLKDCVISSFTVNFTPDGVLRRYKTGHPVSVNMAIEFKELYRADRSDVGVQ